MYDDLRQIGIVSLNEIRKFMSSKKFTIYLVLVIGSILLLTCIPYIVGDGLSGERGSVFAMYVMFAAIMSVLAATLFSSYTIVSEFEERTALILFTRPIRKTTIFVGKFVACIILEAVVIVAYYLVGATVDVLTTTGDKSMEFLPSLSVVLCYMFGCSGIAMLISSLFKKGGTSAIVTFITIMLILGIISSALEMSGIDTWFMLDTCGDGCLEVIPAYIDNMNHLMGMFNDMFGGMEGGPDFSGYMVEAADAVKCCAVEIVWGIVTLFVAWYAFCRREF